MALSPPDREVIVLIREDIQRRARRRRASRRSPASSVSSGLDTRDATRGKPSTPQVLPSAKMSTQARWHRVRASAVFPRAKAYRDRQLLKTPVRYLSTRLLPIPLICAARPLGETDIFSRHRLRARAMASDSSAPASPFDALRPSAPVVDSEVHAIELRARRWRFAPAVACWRPSSPVVESFCAISPRDRIRSRRALRKAPDYWDHP